MSDVHNIDPRSRLKLTERITPQFFHSIVTTLLKKDPKENIGL